MSISLTLLPADAFPTTIPGGSQSYFLTAFPKTRHRCQRRSLSIARHSSTIWKQNSKASNSASTGRALLAKLSGSSNTAVDFQNLVRERMRKIGKEDQFIPFGHPALKEFAAKLMPKWTPRYTSPPFGKWRVRAKAIAKAYDPLSSIRKFTDLRSEMNYLTQAIDDAHEEFWGWVQQQEDAAQDARGR
jgi:hypothetical protein